MCIVFVCVSKLALFSAPGVPITDYQTKERETEQERENGASANNATIRLGTRLTRHATENVYSWFVGLGTFCNLIPEIWECVVQHWVFTPTGMF